MKSVLSSLHKLKICAVRIKPEYLISLIYVISWMALTVEHSHEGKFCPNHMLSAQQCLNLDRKYPTSVPGNLFGKYPTHSLQKSTRKSTQEILWSPKFRPIPSSYELISRVYETATVNVVIIACPKYNESFRNSIFVTYNLVFCASISASHRWATLLYY